ncbi:electron transfer flavoprotein subunit alpha/FixB family protein [Pseudomonas sp. NPDC096917]|uniref:electron transfer flavoprotein subunit alpha/FixB family protein n=1 Tax=Pseudomonas sp. NPDC096917 TaxID=3364483 RepID=UPI00383AC239
MKLLLVIPQAWGEQALDTALAAGQQLAGADGFAVMLIGPQACSRPIEVAASAGAKTVCQVLHPDLLAVEDPYVLACAVAQALAGILSGVSETQLVLLPPGPAGEELAALLADLLDGQHLGRCLSLRVEGEAIFAERAAWGGRLRITLQVESGLAFACLRAARGESGAPATVPVCTIDLDDPLPCELALDKRESVERLPPLEGANLVVSGGRGVNEQGFGLLEALALRLGASLGGSLPAVDAGLVPVLRQVGVSGKFVSPQVYLAVGISGTLQHLAGVSLDSRIVAINPDPEADIFKVATLGIAAPWESLLPALLDALGPQP